MIQRPDYIEKIMPFVDTPFVKVLSGVRRCGKSTILLMVANELKRCGIPDDRILIFNFGSMKYEGIRTAKMLHETIEGHLSNEGRTYLFLDEIQEVDEWEKAVNSFMDDFDVDIFVTGSNSRMMSSEISTYLTGRYVSFKVFPLSFEEYLTFREEYFRKMPGLDHPHGYPYDYTSGFDRQRDRYSEFARYLRLGGFPAVHLQDYTEDQAYTIVGDIYNSSVYSDIVKRNQIRKVDLLERIVKFTFDNIGQTFSAVSIAKYLKNERRSIDNETVYNYLKYLEGAFILYHCSRYDIQGKQLLKTQEKFYLSDLAFRHIVLGYSLDSVPVMLENLVYLELLRRGYSVNVGKINDGEIDFIAAKQEKKIYIQVAERIELEETRQREYGKLLGIADNYPKYVLRTDELSGGNYEGIETMHVADFLLSKKY